MNTESQDVVKAHLRFRRRKDEPPESKSSMPSMKKMVVPAEWPNLKAKVCCVFVLDYQMDLKIQWIDGIMDSDLLDFYGCL